MGTRANGRGLSRIVAVASWCLVLSACASGRLERQSSGGQPSSPPRTGAPTFSGDGAVATDGTAGADAGTPMPGTPMPGTPAPADGAVGPYCLQGITSVNAALDVRTEESCAIWNSLAKMMGTATVTGSGDMLTIDFGNGVIFAGTVTDGNVSLTYIQHHEFGDGCLWQAAETLAGQLRDDCALSLTYTYVESVAVDRGHCASPCSATADVSLKLTPII